MSNIITLFCIIEGENTPFSIKISPDNTIDDVKEAIKKKKENDFREVDADKLSLYHVSIPIGDDDEEKAITLAEQPNAKKLRATSDISDIFGASPSRKTIHVIVQRPLAPPVNDIESDPKFAALRKQLSDMETMLEESKATTVNLGIVDQRQGRKYICRYLTDTKKATIEEFQGLLRPYYTEQYEGDDYVQIYVYINNNDGQLIDTDNKLRALLDMARSNRWRQLTISLDSPAKKFSSWNWNAVVEQYGIHQKPELLPDFDSIQSRPLTVDQRVVLDHIIQDCLYKNGAYLFGLGANEATRSSIVDSFMVGAMHFFKNDMFLMQQQPMSGRLGHGPVDFAVLDRIHQTQVLGVTEVKKDDHLQGLAQNMVQLDVAVNQKKRKREDESGNNSDERPATRSKTYGIVTDSFRWMFVECTLETTNKDKTVQFRTKEIIENLSLKNETDLKAKAEVLFSHLLALYGLMRDEIVSRTSYNNNKDSDHSRQNKRVASGREEQVE